MKQYKHFISLGYFCSVAQELERLGLRDSSSPFDWCTSDFKGVLSAVENHFEDILNPALLYQRKSNPEIYKNIKYDITFFHDFDCFTPLENQLAEVSQKYSRRIERFYKNISEPTLFIRYIQNPKDSDSYSEIKWIEENYDYIINLIKGFNPENDIMFIASKGYVNSSAVKLYMVDADPGEKVARKFAESDDALKQFFCETEYPLREKNLELLNNKSLGKKLHKEVARHTKNIKLAFKKPYIHSRQY